MNKGLAAIGLLYLLIICGCGTPLKQPRIQEVTGSHPLIQDQIWLTHEHLLVDFIGADRIKPETWNRDSVLKELLPYLEELKAFKVTYFVDATPNYLGRDALLLEKTALKTGLRILTNTGLYGARDDLFIPEKLQRASPDQLAEMWIDEFENGIDGTSVKPGFIKIGIDNTVPLSDVDQNLVRAAAKTHLKTGLTIASHTGKASGLWPQLEILKEMGVSPGAFIWVHAQNEISNKNYLRAAKMGCWISLDGLGWEMEEHVKKLVFAKSNGILNRVLISHDAGWYDPQKKTQEVRPYSAIFKKLYSELKARGFTDDEFNLLVSVNPPKAFALEIRKSHFD